MLVLERYKLPIRIGFTQYRSQLLKHEMDRVVSELPSLGISKAIVVGDLAKYRVTPSSILEMIFVHETEASFLDRIDFFTSHLTPSIGMDVSVYTPKEFSELQNSNLFVMDALKNGWIVYE